MELFKLFGTIAINNSDANKAIQETTGKAEGGQSKIVSAFKKIGTAAVTYFAVDKIKSFGAECVNMASDVEEMENKFNVVFDGMQDEVDKWATNYATAIGRNKNAIKEYLADNQNMFVGMGMTRESAAGLSENLVSLALDLASFNNLNETDAVNAMSKAIMGETESAKTLGAVLNDNTRAIAMEQLGYEGKFASLTEAQKMEVNYQAILNQSADAIGDCERSLDSYKGRQIQAASAVQNLKEKIGSYLLPVMTKFQQVIGTVATWLSNHLDPAIAIVKNTFEILGGYISGILQPLIENLRQVFAVLADYWMQNVLPNIQYMIEAFTNFVSNVYEAVQPAIEEIINKFSELYTAIINAVQQYIIPYLQAFINMLMQLWTENKDKLNKIQTLFKTIFDVIAGYVAWWVDTVKNYIIPFLAFILDAVKKNMDNIKKTIQSVINLISAIIDAFIALFTGNWTGLWEAIKSILSAALDVVKNAFNTAFTFICNVFSPLTDFFSGIWNGIQGVFINVGTWFGNVFKTAVDNIKTFFSPLTDFFSQMWSKITSLFKDIGVAIGDAISGAVRAGINGVLGGAVNIINGFISALNGAISVINAIPGVSISHINQLAVPQLEKGGILEKGEVGLLEGNGAEAVVPLDQNKKWISAVAKDMSNAIGGSNNNEEVEKTLAAVNQTLKELPKMIFNALTSGDVKFEVGSREFARLVKVVNT